MKRTIQNGLEKWNDFNAVTDRLNSPELVSHYEIRQIGYIYSNKIHSYTENASYRYYAEYVFEHKKGDCCYISGFTVYRLRKPGYHAYLWNWPTPGGESRCHVIAAYEDNGKKMAIDNGKPNPHKTGIVPLDIFKKK